MCYTVDANERSIYIPSLSKLLDLKIACLRGNTWRMFQDMVADYDKDVQIQCQAIHNAIKEIAAKQELMRENFGHMIDQVLANVGGDEDDGDGTNEGDRLGTC
jgi:hypothetical protein